MKSRVIAALALALLVSVGSAMPEVAPTSLLGALSYLLSPEYQGDLSKRARKRLERLDTRLRASSGATHAEVVSLARKAASAMVSYQDGDDLFLGRLQRSTAILIDETRFEGCVLTAVVENDETHWVGRRRERVLAKLARVQAHTSEAARLLTETLPAVGAKDPDMQAHKRALRELRKAIKLNARVSALVKGTIGFELDEKLDPKLDPKLSQQAVTVRHHLPGTEDPGLVVEGAHATAHRAQGTGGGTVWSFRIVLGDSLAPTTRVLAIEVPQTGPFLTGTFTPGDGSGTTGGFQDPYRIHTESAPLTMDFGAVQYDESDLTMSFYVEIHAINDLSYVRVDVELTDIPIQ